MTPVKAKPDKDTWTMKTSLFSGIPIRYEYFYEGEVVVRDGVVEIPRTRPEWAQRLLVLGYEWADGEPEDFKRVR